MTDGRDSPGAGGSDARLGGGGTAGGAGAVGGSEGGVGGAGGAGGAGIGGSAGAGSGGQTGVGGGAVPPTCVRTLFGDYLVRKDGLLLYQDIVQQTTILDAAGGQPLGMVATVTGGESHGCAGRADGSALCWPTTAQGNAYGQLGNNAATPPLYRAVPVHISPTTELSGVSVMAAGSAAFSLNTSCAVKTDHTMWCWGDTTQVLNNGVDQYSVYAGQLMADSTTPFGNVIAASLSYTNACALVTTGTANEVRCWGMNAYGVAGNGTQSRVRYPTRVAGIVNPSALRVTSEAACALEGDRVKCWGQNSNGECGANSPDPVILVPTLVKLSDGSTLDGVVAIETGFNDVCALRSSGALYCWGQSAFLRYAAPYEAAGVGVSNVTLIGDATTPRFLTSDASYHLGQTTRAPNCGPLM